MNNEYEWYMNKYMIAQSNITQKPTDQHTDIWKLQDIVDILTGTVSEIIWTVVSTWFSKIFKWTWQYS